MQGLGWESGDQNGRQPGDEPEGVIETDEQLALTGDDTDLPWLDGDDDYEEEPGHDYRILIFAVVAVLALAAILFGANRFFSRGSDSTAEPDGSIIAAPDGAYKEPPQDPGGAEVAGTGDLSYEVGEGQGREGQIAGGAPAPSFDVGPSPSSGPAAGSGAAAAPQAPAAGAGVSSATARTTGVGVQVGAFSTRAAAEAGWNQLAGRYSVLQGLGHRVVEGTADSGTIYRLQAIASDVEAANALCRAIRNAGGDCQVKR